MKVIICPGIHETQLTDRFLQSLLRIESEKVMNSVNSVNEKFLVFATDKYPAYSPLHVYQWLNKPEILTDELLFICFSAGVVGGIGAAIALQLKRVKIKAFIAIDGWGVPLFTNFPLYRFSHDYFTHWSSAILGTGESNFYSDPPVPHLTLWETPETCQGWIVNSGNNHQKISKIKSSAKDYLQEIIGITDSPGNT
ncbi:conserved hypothetical protein [Hyella patelloides LEGE 07179]|uniref:Alpha/beta hydrolase n=1 Tax=Hyella patelloides LEGE 07179 TaxID=945734 RepID=A0A563VUH2_9CYAN|nr:hypothetical protein [Hyella patelloides]VEP15122.1 conserved hypothetical protein [Hyella patelloides LEGE 07179]